MVNLPSYERFLNLILEYVPLNLITEFMVTEEEQERVQELLDRKSEDIITPEERRELDEIVKFEGMMIFLKAKALYTTMKHE